MDKFLEIVFYITGACVILFIVIFIGDRETSKIEFMKGVIVDESYSAAKSSTSTGMAITSKGVAPVVLTSSSPDSWVLMVRRFDGSVIKIQASPTDFYSVKIGDTLTYVRITGGWTGRIIGNRSLNK